MVASMRPCGAWGLGSGRAKAQKATRARSSVFLGRDPQKQRSCSAWGCVSGIALALESPGCAPGSQHARSMAARQGSTSDAPQPAERRRGRGVAHDAHASGLTLTTGLTEACRCAGREITGRGRCLRSVDMLCSLSVSETVYSQRDRGYHDSPSLALSSL